MLARGYSVSTRLPGRAQSIYSIPAESICQDCFQPLDIRCPTDEAERFSLVESFVSSFDAVGSPEASRRTLESVEESFVMLPDGGQRRPSKPAAESAPDTDSVTRIAGLNTQIQLLQRTLEVASKYTKVEQPLCDDCVKAIIKRLDNDLHEANEEKEVYQKQLLKLSSHDEEPLSADAFAAEMARTQADENALLAQLAQVEAERAAVRAEHESLLREQVVLTQQEEAKWLEVNRLERQLLLHRDETDSLHEKIGVASDQLAQLKRTNVYNDVFHIYHDGHFGTISGFRLGNLPSQPIDWNEVNAAWGQAALLLSILAHKVSVSFRNFRPDPLGSYSRMVKVSDPKTSFELFGSSEFMLGRIFWYSRYNKAIASFVECVAELNAHLEALPSAHTNKKMPYKIEGEKIGGIKVKMELNQNENWTKAMKFLLTNLKFLLSNVSRLSPD